MLDITQYLKDKLQQRNLDKDGVPKKRSSKWRKVRNKYLSLFPKCASCGSKKKLTVHHRIPFSIDPELELNSDNLITLCEGGRSKLLNCHLVFGHLLSFRDFNPSVKSDAMAMYEKLRNEKY